VIANQFVCKHELNKGTKSKQLQNLLGDTNDLFKSVMMLNEKCCLIILLFSSKMNGEHGSPLQNSYTLFITSKNMCKTNRFIKAGVQ
jgi:hypothetical protein